MHGFEASEQGVGDIVRARIHNLRRKFAKTAARPISFRRGAKGTCSSAAPVPPARKEKSSRGLCSSVFSHLHSELWLFCSENPRILRNLNAPGPHLEIP
jgi:hypothetical protein